MFYTFKLFDSIQYFNYIARIKVSNLLNQYIYIYLYIYISKLLRCPDVAFIARSKEYRSTVGYDRLSPEVKNIAQL